MGQYRYPVLLFIFCFVLVGCTLNQEPEYSSYVIEEYLEKLDRSGYELYGTKDYGNYYIVGSTVYADNVNYLGYELNLEHPDNVLSGVVDKDSTLVLKTYYKRTTNLVRFVGRDGEFWDWMWLPEVAPNSLIQEPTRPGDYIEHTFVAWFKDSELTEQWDFASDVVNSNMVLYSKWAPRKYTITFDPGDGTIYPTSKIVTYGETYGELPIPIPNNSRRQFIAWRTTDRWGWPVNLTVTENSELAWLQDHTLTAVYN